MTRLITQDGLKKIEDELAHRRDVIRHEISAAIKEAKDQGDLSENAEYSAAKEDQVENEMRIKELEMTIKNAQVVVRDESITTVQIGSKVTIDCNGNKMSLEIVGSNEAEPPTKISNESPMGQAFMGKSEGDTVDVTAPSGVMQCKILEVL